MPLSKIHVPESFPPALVSQIGQALHDSLVETCAVNPDDYFHYVHRYAAGDMQIHPTFLAPRDAARTLTIEVTLLAGRTDDQKEALYANLRDRLAALGLDPANAIVFLVENNAIDWSFTTGGSVKRVMANR